MHSNPTLRAQKSAGLKTAEHQKTRAHLISSVFPPDHPLSWGPEENVSSVTSPEGTEEESASGRCAQRVVWGKLTYFSTGLFGCELSLLLRHRPHKRQLLPGIHPEPKGHLVRGRKDDFTCQGEEARRRASAVPGTRGSGVLGAARSAMRPGVAAARDHSRRTPAPAQPPLQPASRSRDRRGPATTSERLDSGQEDHHNAPPIGSRPGARTAVGAGRVAREGASRLEWGGGNEVRRSGCPSQATPPDPPRPSPPWCGPSGRAHARPARGKRRFGSP